jgi:hypothetical protein
VLAAPLGRWRLVGAVATAAILGVVVPLVVLAVVVAGPPPPGEPVLAGHLAEASGSGTLTVVSGISVDVALARPLHQLLDAAASDGLVLAGSGHRTAAAQIALRRDHCGSSHYAIFDMPASECSPPTARPGESMHEQGLAIDFMCSGVLVRRHDRCFRWLAAKAAAFGLFNLPSEPWHWSVNGR